MNIQPMDDRIVLRRLDPILKSGRIILPEVAREKQLRCEVVAIGPGERDSDYPMVRKPMQVQPGDVVYIGKYTDTEYEDLVTAQQDDVRVIVGCERDLMEKDRDYAFHFALAGNIRTHNRQLFQKLADEGCTEIPPVFCPTGNQIETPIQPPKKMRSR